VPIPPPPPPLSAMRLDEAVSAGEKEDIALPPPPKPIIPAKDTMVFWKRIFEPAKESFITRPEPEKVSKSACGIRNETTWDGIYR